MASLDEIVARYFDAEGRLTCWPSRKFPNARRGALARLAAALTPGEEYSEGEVNDLIKARHTFSDHVLLRREMVDGGLIQRTRNGRTYWRPAPVEE